MMKKSALLIFFSLYMASVFSQTGINFFKGSWSEAKLKAKTENKEIYLDCYTTWCSPCKQMEYNVYTDTSVGRYYNQHYICYRMDMEAGEGPAIASMYEVKYYPTHLFFNSSGELIHREFGFKEVSDFIQLGKDGIDPNTQAGKFWLEYEKGNRDHGFLLDYCEYLKKERLNYANVFDEYIGTQKDQDDSIFLTEVFQYTSVITAKAYQIFQKNENKFIQWYGTSGLSNKYKFVILDKSISAAAKIKNDSLYHVIEKLYPEKTHIEDEKSLYEDVLFPYLKKSAQYQKYFDTLEYYMQKHLFSNHSFDEMTRLVKDNPNHQLLKDADNATEVKHMESQSSAVGAVATCVEHYNSIAFWLNNYAFYFVYTPDEYNKLSEETLEWIQLALSIQERNKEKDAPVFAYYEAYAKIYFKLHDYPNALLYAQKAEAYANKHLYPSDELLEIINLVANIKAKM